MSEGLSGRPCYSAGGCLWPSPRRRAARGPRGARRPDVLCMMRLGVASLRTSLLVGCRRFADLTAQLRARVLLLWRLLFVVTRLTLADVTTAAELPPDELLAEVRKPSQRKEKTAEERAAGHRQQSVLAIDIGGKRTKFMLVDGSTITRLPPAPTSIIWQNPALEGHDKFDPATAPRRMQAYLQEHGVSMKRIGRLAFSVPGTVDLTESRGGKQQHETLADDAQTGTGSEGHGSEGHTGSDGFDEGAVQMTVVKNTPSMSPRFRGFDFKDAFHDVSPYAKVSAIADNLAAALGVACQQPQLRSALVLVLGTAPAVATLVKMASALSEDRAPSASLDSVKSQAAPTHPGAPSRQLGGLR